LLPSSILKRKLREKEDARGGFVVRVRPSSFVFVPRVVWPWFPFDPALALGYTLIVRKGANKEKERI
jgi:hypothetical protein